MPAGDKERQGESDDLFEDLDKFFAPVEEDDWPDQTERRAGGDEGSMATPGGIGAVRDDPELDREPDILEQDWGGDIEGPPETPPDVPSSIPEHAARSGPPDESAPPSQPPPSFVREPAGEVGSDDWTRLRGVLGEDQEDEYDFDLPSEEPAGQEDTMLGFDELEQVPDQRSMTSSRGDAPSRPGAVSLGRHEQRPPNERGTDRSAFAELETEPQQDDKTTPRRDQDADDLLEGTDRPASVRTVKVGEPEAVLGPAWEEPSSRAVSHDASSDAAADDRDLPTAVISGAVLLAAALIAAALSKTAFAVVAGLVVLVAQAELYAAMRRAGYQPASALGLAIGALVLAGAYLRGEPAMVFFLALGLVLSFLWYMAAPPKSRAATVSHLGATVLGLVYVPFLAGFALTILSMPWGRAFTLAVLGLTFLYDTTAFVIGRTWGSRPLAPTVSPRKSWEGLSAATVVTVAVAIAVLPSIAPIDPSWARAIAAGLVVVVFAPLGDLAESLLKRDLGVKDMGGFLPGHGGILDRIDSVLFVAPAVFYFLRLIL